MATLFMLCGLPGSGKTTLAKDLEISRPALRLCPDEWIASLLANVTDTAELSRLRSPVEAIQWDVAKRNYASRLMWCWKMVSGLARDERAGYRAGSRSAAGARQTTLS